MKIDECYVKGNPEYVKKVIEFVKPMLGKNKLHIINIHLDLCPECDKEVRGVRE